MNLELSKAETEILQDFLSSSLANLNYEIANTDLQRFRDQLKEKREVLKKLEKALAE